MSNDLHDIDDLFRSALEENEETPSASVKESLLANLDKKDAESYKKRFIGWKRIALLLLLVLAGFILYESGIVKSGAGRSTKKIIPIAIGTKKTDTRTPARDAVNDQGSDNTTTGKKIPENGKIVHKKESAGNENSSDDADELIQPGQKENKELNKELVRIKKYKQSAKQIISLAGNKKKETASDLLKRGNIDNIEVRAPEENLTKEKRNFVPAIEKLNLAKINSRPVTGMQHPPAIGFKMATIIDSLLKNNIAKNAGQKRIHHFKPWWTITGLVSYDRVNYMLDSDQPNAITSIQHREVHEPSFSAGILATRQLKEKWGLQTGLVYSNTAIGISPQKMYAFQDPAGDIAYKYITSSGYAYIKPGFGTPPAFGDSITTTEAKHSLHSLSVPVVVKYTIGRNRFLFIPGAGIEANFITRAKLETEIEDAANRETVFINKLNGAKSFYWSLVADAELRYNVNKKFSFSLRPVFRYAISPITENNVVETFPYSFGTGLGITYKF